MLEQRLTQALHAARPEPPQDFDRRSDMQLLRLRTKEEKQVKKVSGLVIALALVLALGMTAAVAAGVIRWQQGLEDSLQLTEETKEYYSDTALFDTPNLSVTDQGVTVTLEQCIVDEHAAYIAFRVSGYTPSEGEQPAFMEDSCQAGLTGASYTGGRFYNGLRHDGDGTATYLDGSAVDWSQPLPYAAENGDLLYVISMLAGEETFPGRTVDVTLSGLGVYADKWGDIRVDVPGTWTFQWELKGTEGVLSLTGMKAAIGPHGAVLNEVRLSPITIEMNMTVPRGIADEDDLLPYLVGVRMKNGEERMHITGAGMDGYVSEQSDEVHVLWALEQLLIPSEVESLLFTLPVDGGDQLWEVKIN